LLKYEPFANLKALREIMLYIFRENYISSEEIVNTAFKQYKYWSNLVVEEIKNCIKNNSPKFTELEVAENDPSIQKKYRKYFNFHDPENYPEYEHEIGFMHLEIKIYCDFKNKEEKIYTNKWNSWFEVMAKILDKEIKQTNFGSRK
jgi:hypothetical protein